MYVKWVYGVLPMQQELLDPLFSGHNKFRKIH